MCWVLWAQTHRQQWQTHCYSHYTMTSTVTVSQCKSPTFRVVLSKELDGQFLSIITLVFLECLNSSCSFRRRAKLESQIAAPQVTSQTTASFNYISSADWANSTNRQKMCVCVCVNQLTSVTQISTETYNPGRRDLLINSFSGTMDPILWLPSLSRDWKS